MQEKQPDQLPLKSKIKIVAGVLAVFAPLFLVMMFAVYPHTPHIVKLKVTPAKPARSHAVKIQKKRKTKMVKIALGHTKSINVTSFFNGGIGFADYDRYAIDGETPVSNGADDPAGFRATWTPYDDASAPSSIPVDVKVPLDASAMGVKTLVIRPQDQNGDEKLHCGTIQFEVVCIESVTITATPTPAP